MRLQGLLLALFVLVCVYLDTAQSCSCRYCTKYGRSLTDLTEESRTFNQLFPCCPLCSGTGDVSGVTNAKCGIKKAGTFRNKNKNRKNKNKKNKNRRRGDTKKNKRQGRQDENVGEVDDNETIISAEEEINDDQDNKNLENTSTKNDNEDEKDVTEDMDEIDDGDDTEDIDEENDTENMEDKNESVNKKKKKNKRNKDEKIVGGQDAEENEYPWIVGLTTKGAATVAPYCGGSLIASQWVLTAVHCIRLAAGDTPASQISVLLGDHSLSDLTDGNVQMVDVQEYFLNPSYVATGSVLQNDVALLKLATEVDLSVYTPVCLPPDAALGSQYDNQIATAVGWGALSSGGASPDILQEVEVTVVPLATCTTNYAPDAEIMTGMLCAAAAGKDTCQGDSGGPLTVPTNNQHFQVGITSFGSGCALAGFPGVYADVANYRSWILCKISENGGAVFSV